MCSTIPVTIAGKSPPCSGKWEPSQQARICLSTTINQPNAAGGAGDSEGLVREQVGWLNAMTEHDTWDAAARARVSDRWAEASAHWNTAMTDALLSAAAISPDSIVLDLAAGSGDPALTIAERVIRARVIALDSSRSGLLLANTHARRLGLGAKVTFVQADAHAIPFKANCVNRVTCRCGIMFFNDTRLVMSEVLRVLKPGGRVSFLVWDSFEQPFFDATVSVVLRLVRGAQMPIEARKMFRLLRPVRWRAY